MKRLLLVTILTTMLLYPTKLWAQDSIASPVCPVFTSIEFEVGGTRLIDTYLSPWCYKGWGIALNIELMQAMPLDNYHWVWQQQIGVNYGDSKISVTGAGKTIYGGLNYMFAMMRRSVLPIDGLQLYYGADLALVGEGIYNYHGGNNPAAVKADISLGLTGMAVYNFKLGKLPVTARYQLLLPVIGIFGQPEYSESYYEVSLGNHHNFLHCGTWANKFDIDNRLTVDMHFNSWALRVGYHNRINTTYVTNNRYQLVQHNFTIGFAGDLLSWSKKNSNRSVLRALYDTTR